MTFTERGGEEPLRIPFAPVLGIWLVLGLLDTAQTAASQVAMDRPPNVLQQLAYTMPSYFWLALLTPLIFALCARFPLEEPRLHTHAALHLLAALCFPVPHLLASAFTASLVPLVDVAPLMLVRKWAMGFYVIDVFRYAAVTAVYHALRASRRARLRSVELEQVRADAAAARASLADARLQSLTTRIRPHFLFNSLNVISGLALQQKPEHAAGLIAALSDLLRRSLRQPDNLTTLGEELEFVRAYLAIEQARLGPRLHVTVDVPEELHEMQVPSFLLQPLVENAVQHGVAARAEDGDVDVRAWQEDDMLVLEVSNTGEDFVRTERAGGLGIPTTRARLESIYGNAAALEFSLRHGGGTRVQVRLPLNGPAVPGSRG